MKRILNQCRIKNICLLLLITLCFTACKKDAMRVDSEKYYVQVNAAPVTDALVSGSVSLTLKPGGVAGIRPGGDIVWMATYDISGDKITVKVNEINSKFKFTIITDSELHGEHGEVLKLTTN